MNKIQDCLRFNNVPYKDFDSEIKDKLDRFVKKLDEMGFTLLQATFCLLIQPVRI
jgi:hypothetical protein